MDTRNCERCSAYGPNSLVSPTILARANPPCPPWCVGLCRFGFTCIIGSMKQYGAGVAVLLVAALAVPIQGIAEQDRVVVDSAVLGETSSQPSSSTPKTNGPSQPPIALPSTAASSVDVRDIPSISGRYAIGGKTLVPYIGAGFSGGYSSEFNRSLAVVPPTQNDLGLRSQFGQSVSPNEFQLGVRIPF